MPSSANLSFTESADVARWWPARPPARARPRSGLKGAATRPARAMDGAGRTYGVIDT